MVGITSYGAYVPLFRLSRETIAKGARGEKAICNFDEDSLTMAVAATIDCLNGITRDTVDGLSLATTTSPYKEHLGATTVAMAADLRRDIYTMDFTNSLRAGTSALKAAVDAVKSGSVKKMMVATADCRLGKPAIRFMMKSWMCGGTKMIPLSVPGRIGLPLSKVIYPSSVKQYPV
jgi:3-hydroxy-3-methylglutaryl CoA synthase